MFLHHSIAVADPGGGVTGMITPPPELVPILKTYLLPPPPSGNPVSAPGSVMF